MASIETPAQTATGPAGIGGWLILMAIGQVTGPFYVLAGMINEWADLPEGIASTYPTAVLGDYGLRFLYVAFLVYVAVLFFNKRADFPRMFVWTYVAGLALPFAIAAWVSSTTPVNTMANLASGDFLRAYAMTVVVGGIWTAYVLNSVRVKNTFVI